VQVYKDAVERIFACLTQGVEELLLDSSPDLNEMERKVRSF